jgi:hypothetical protein
MVESAAAAPSKPAIFLSMDNSKKPLCVSNLNLDNPFARGKFPDSFI